MANSKVEIANMALTLLGSSLITSLDDPQRTATIIKQNWNMCRDAVLRAYPWNCARKRETLSPIANKQDSEGNIVQATIGWTYKYQLPVDCIRVLEVYDDSDFTVEGRYLFANVSVIRLCYTTRLENVTLQDPLLDMALAAYIAHTLSMAISQSTTITDSLWQKYRQLVSEARSIDAQEGAVKVVEAWDWLDSRNSLGPPYRPQV